MNVLIFILIFIIFLILFFFLFFKKKEETRFFTKSLTEKNLACNLDLQAITLEIAQNTEKFNTVKKKHDDLDQSYRAEFCKKKDDYAKAIKELWNSTPFKNILKEKMSVLYTQLNNYNIQDVWERLFEFFEDKSQRILNNQWYPHYFLNGMKNFMENWEKIIKEN